MTLGEELPREFGAEEALRDSFSDVKHPEWPSRVCSPWSAFVQDRLQEQVPNNNVHAGFLMKPIASLS